MSAPFKPKSVSFPGGGVKAFYQFGVACRLRSELSAEELDELKVYGASCGALAAVFLKTGVDVHKATQLAFDLCLSNGVIERPAGLIGVWGRIIEDWLNQLLPDNAHILCNKKVFLQVLTSKGVSKLISEFESKNFLVQVLLASTHIPLVLDGKMFRTIDGERFLDGYILGEVPGLPSTSVCSFPDHVARIPVVKLLDLEAAQTFVKHGMDVVPSSTFVTMDAYPVKKTDIVFRSLVRIALFFVNVWLFMFLLFLPLFSWCLHPKGGRSTKVSGAPPNQSYLSASNTSSDKSLAHERPACVFAKRYTPYAGKIVPGLQVWVVDTFNEEEELRVRQGVVQRLEKTDVEPCWSLAFSTAGRSYDSDTFYPESRLYLSYKDASDALNNGSAAVELHNEQTQLESTGSLNSSKRRVAVSGGCPFKKTPVSEQSSNVH